MKSVDRQSTVKSISLPDSRVVPVLGVGTWRMGETRRSRAAEVAALRHAFELGYRLVDTADTKLRSIN